MIATTVHADAASSSTTTIVAVANVVSSQTVISLNEIIHSNLDIQPTKNAGADFNNTIETVNTECWNAERGLRFKKLSLKESLEDLSVEELVELNTLTRLRRFEKYPRTADEILWHRRQTNVTTGLLQALEQYVDFHQAAHNA